MTELKGVVQAIGWSSTGLKIEEGNDKGGGAHYSVFEEGGDKEEKCFNRAKGENGKVVNIRLMGREDGVTGHVS